MAEANPRAKFMKLIYSPSTTLSSIRPSCGAPTRLGNVDHLLVRKFKTKQAMYQYVDKTAMLRAATESGGEMIKCFLNEDDQAQQGKLISWLDRLGGIYFIPFTA